MPPCLLPLSLLILLTLSASTRAEDLVRLNPAQRKAAGIQVSPVSSVGAAPQTLRLQGFAVLPPQAMETVSAPVSGFVQSVSVAATDVLRAGQPVAQMTSAEWMQWQREYVQLDLQTRQAQDRLARSERLEAEGIVAAARVREDRYAYQQASVAAQERRRTLQSAGLGEIQLKRLGEQPQVQSQLSVHTQRAGTVVEVLVSSGQRVEAGSPLIKLARSGMLALELQATAVQSLQLVPGAMVKVAPCVSNGRLRGLGSLMRGGNQAVTVHVDLPNGMTCLRPNQAVEAEINLGRSAANSPQNLSVPTSALLQHGNHDQVFVQEGEGFRITPVQVKTRGPDWADLVSGVKPGDLVVSQGVAALKATWLGMGETSRRTPDKP